MLIGIAAICGAALYMLAAWFGITGKTTAVKRFGLILVFPALILTIGLSVVTYGPVMTLPLLMVIGVAAWGVKIIWPKVQA